MAANQSAFGQFGLGEFAPSRMFRKHGGIKKAEATTGRRPPPSAPAAQPAAAATAPKGEKKK